MEGGNVGNRGFWVETEVFSAILGINTDTKVTLFYAGGYGFYAKGAGLYAGKTGKE